MVNNSGIYLAFILGKESYGINVLNVEQIIGYTEIHQIPRMPKFIKGVINLRGKIIPLMDLRLKFLLEEKVYTDRTIFIVLEVNLNREKKQMALAVDSVSEVLNIGESEIEQTPRYGIEVDDDFIIGMAKKNSQVIMLLDIEKLLNEKELNFLKTENAKGTGDMNDEKS